MSVVLIVTLEVARALHASDPASPVYSTIKSAGGEIYPMPAFSPGELGERTFTLEAPEPQALCDHLLGLTGVEACYVKPVAEPP